MSLVDLRGAGEEVVLPSSLTRRQPRAVSRPAPRFSARRYLGVFTVLSDAFALMFGLALASSVHVLAGRDVLHDVPYAPVFLVAISAGGLHDRSLRRIHRSWFRDVGVLARSLAWASAAAVVISNGAHWLVGAPKLSWGDVAVFSAFSLATVPLIREIGLLLSRRQGAVLSRAAVLGSSWSAGRVARRLERSPDFCLVGVITDGEPFPDSCSRVLGGTFDLPDICERNEIDRLFVSTGGPKDAFLVDTLRDLPAGVQVSIVPDLSELLTWQSRIEDLDGMAVMDLPVATSDWTRRTAKRALDVAVSALALVCIAPLLLLVAAAIKLTSPGPVFFRQTRTGYRGKPFQIVKFRTMRTGAEDAKVSLLDLTGADPRLFKLSTDPRVTTVGRVLRRTSVDELPQLFNVVIGQMSLVGPRPLPTAESACFEGWATRRFDVKPGMTGLWQVSGRSDLPFEELCELDCVYAASWSVLWDLKILSQTPGSVLFGRGAY